jgi:hypothetical protein
MPARLVDEFIRLMIATHGSLTDFGEPEVTEDILRQAVLEGKTLTLCDDEARWGEFEDLEAFLVKHGIHFNRHSDAFGESDGVLVFHRGGVRFWYLASQSGDLLLAQEQVVEILQRDSSDQEKIAALQTLAMPPELTPLEPLQIQEDTHE